MSRDALPNMAKKSSFSQFYPGYFESNNNLTLMGWMFHILELTNKWAEFETDVFNGICRVKAPASLQIGIIHGEPKGRVISLYIYSIVIKL